MWKAYGRPLGGADGLQTFFRDLSRGLQRHQEILLPPVAQHAALSFCSSSLRFTMEESREGAGWTKQKVEMWGRRSTDSPGHSQAPSPGAAPLGLVVLLWHNRGHVATGGTVMRCQ